MGKQEIGPRELALRAQREAQMDEAPKVKGPARRKTKPVKRKVRR